MNEIYRKAANGEGQIASYSKLCEAPKGIIQFVHDISEHARRYDELANTIVSSGFDFYANDMVGHGMSKQGHKGTFAMKDQSLEYLVEDIATLFDYAKEKSGDLLRSWSGSASARRSRPFTPANIRISAFWCLSARCTAQGRARSTGS